MRLHLISLIVLFGAICTSAAQDDFNLVDEIALCTGCHGEDGVPIEPDYPVIWGQEYFYLYTQLRDYAAGRRENEIMNDIAANYTREQAKLLAQHFAALEWPGIPAAVEDGSPAAGYGRRPLKGGRDRLRGDAGPCTGRHLAGGRQH